MELLRRFASEAPPARAFRDDKPTLLVCWWCTVCAITIIIFRIFGRFVRAEKMFLDDKIMLASVVPLLGRMGFLHVVLLFGTNNALTAGLTDEDIRRRTIGSGMLLLARIFDAIFLWSIKYSILMFLRSLTSQVRTGLHTRMLQGTQILLGVTFVAVIISILAECQPFSNYWRVVPDPGPSCRQTPAQFITLAVAHSFTNLALVVLPIPMIVMSRIPNKRKITTTILLSLPLLNIVYTASTSNLISRSLFTQHTRSLLSSLDALLNAFIANAVVLCALLQDKGYKKSKYRHAKQPTSPMTKTKSRVHDPWDSDEELITARSAIGMGSRRSGSKVAVGGESRDIGCESPIEMMPMAKLGSIRVKQTWEVAVEDRGAPGRIV